MAAGSTVPTGQSHNFKLNANADQPDTNQRLFKEEDVTPRFGLSPNDAYDLALFKEKGSSTRGVLVVTMKLQFFFADGRGKQPGDVMRPLVWTDPEKQPFVDKFKERVTAAWERKHRLVTTSSLPTVKEVGVRLDLQTSIEGFDAEDHWEVTVTKVDAFETSFVNCFSGNGSLDNFDIELTPKGAPSGPQLPAAHELGHMLGIRDEYLDKDGKPEDNPAHTGDVDSMMHAGNIVRARHYANFAHWINEQFATAARLSGVEVEFKVNGTLSAKDAKL